MTARALIMRSYLLSALALLFFLPIAAFAFDASFPFVNVMEFPYADSVYAYGSDVIVSGTWQIPPHWAGNLYFYEDGVLMKNKSGETYAAFSNIDSDATATEAYSFNIGSQPDGNHTMQVVFWGGEECAINAFTGGGGKTCMVTPANFVFDQGYSLRHYLVSIPAYARLSVEENDAAGDISRILPGRPESKLFTLTNTGGRALTGSVETTGEKFSCVRGCTYKIGPGASQVTEFQLGTTTPASDGSQLIRFTCVEAGVPCRFAPETFRRIESSMNGAPHATSTPKESKVVPPALSVSPSSLTTTANVGGAPVYHAFAVYNVGNGPLSGSVEISPESGFGCIFGCAYNALAPGRPWLVTLQFVPPKAGTFVGSATFTSKDGTSTMVTLRGTGNASPVGMLVPATISFGDVQVGDRMDATTTLEDRGIGDLSGELSLSAPFSCEYGCRYHVQSGGKTTIIIGFSPHAPGYFTKTIEVGAQELTLSGRGVAH